MIKKLMLFLLLSFVILVSAACGNADPVEDQEQTPIIEAEPENAENPDLIDESEPDSDNDERSEPALPGEWRIGIMTGSASHNEEEYMAALMLEQRFGADRIIRTTYPDNFGAEMGVTIANMQMLAAEGAQAIVVTQAVHGTISAIQSTREMFDDDIFFFVGSAFESPVDVAQYADIAIVYDDISAGRTIVEQAHSMGAETFVHITIQRHLDMEDISERRAFLYQAATELEIQWIELIAPDPITEGLAATHQFIIENVPRSLAGHGPNVAFFATGCDMQEPLITQIANYGGFYLQCCPSPFHILPDVLNVSMDGHEGDVEFLISQTRAAIADLGAAGRFSAGAVPVNMFLVEVGVMYSIEYLEGNIDRHDRNALRRIIDEVAASYSASVEISNWPLDDDAFIDNFYGMLIDFIRF